MSERLCTPVFIDVAGSTALYERLGDAVARSRIRGCLDDLVAVVRAHGGRVIKEIGDELMCVFDAADAAVDAAVAAQLRLDEQAARHGGLQVRIGMQTGTAIEADGDLFGDVVNVAARMAGIAKARQVILGDAAAQALGAANRGRIRLFDRVKVKGKSEEAGVWQVLWEPEQATAMMAAIADPYESAPRLALTMAGRTITLGDGRNDLRIGRDASCTLVVTADAASRFHCTIEQRRGKFVLRDESTNGTFVRQSNGVVASVRREEFLLFGDGVLSLGRPVSGGDPELISYVCS